MHGNKVVSDSVSNVGTTGIGGSAGICMWLKVGTRGDWRVIYVIIAFFVFIGLHDAYYQLYDLNDGPAKRLQIVREVKSVMPLSDEIRVQDSEVTEHIGGGREYKSILYSPLDKQSISNLF